MLETRILNQILSCLDNCKDFDRENFDEIFACIHDANSRLLYTKKAWEHN